MGRGFGMETMETRENKDTKGGIEVVSLSGSWREMGRQYGRQVSAHLHHVYDFMMRKISGDASQTDPVVSQPASEKAAAVREMADRLVARYPHQFREFFRGTAETSGLSYSQLTLINAVEYTEGFYCSGIAVWGDYSKDGRLVYGRNYDGRSFAPIAQDLLVTVFHPADGSIPTAIVGYAGELYAVNAFNRAGLFLELNNSMPSAGSEFDFERFSGTASLLEMMFQAEDLDYVDAFFQTHRGFASFLIGVADSRQARVYEWCAQGMKRSDHLMPEGLAVLTNHYVHPDWPFAIPSDADSWNSISRRAHLLALAEASKGDIDAEGMCRIVSMPFEEGGPQLDLTLYQMVFEPAGAMLRFRVGGSSTWTLIDLNIFF